MEVRIRMFVNQFSAPRLPVVEVALFVRGGLREPMQQDQQLL